jgi:hypothetical protein
MNISGVASDGPEQRMANHLYCISELSSGHEHGHEHLCCISLKTDSILIWTGIGPLAKCRLVVTVR